MGFTFEKFNKSNSTIPSIFSDFIENWVKICAPAKTKIQSEGTELSFEDKCTNCEKVK